MCAIDLFYEYFHFISAVLCSSVELQIEDFIISYSHGMSLLLYSVFINKNMHLKWKCCPFPFLEIQKTQDFFIASALYRIFCFNLKQHKIWTPDRILTFREGWWRGGLWITTKDRGRMEAVALVLHFLLWKWYSCCPGAVFHMLRWYSTGCASCATCLCALSGISEFNTNERRHRAMILMMWHKIKILICFNSVATWIVSFPPCFS